MRILKSLFQGVRHERTAADLARWLDEPEADLRAWLSGRPPWSRGYDYRRFTIPKRRGGVRQIEAPGDKLKNLQRRILARLLNPLPQPACVTGFVKGRSIVDNARPHAGRAVVISLDLADFFPSIGMARVEEVFRGLGWNAEAAGILARICTSEGSLPQGAPTSPALSNLACRRLDRRLDALARACRGSYTRYADDITLSFEGFGRNKRRRRRPPGVPNLARPARGPGRGVLTVVRNIFSEEGFALQMKKRVRVQRAHQRQTATGLVVNQKVNLPRAVRRQMRAMQYRQRRGALDDTGQRRLRGLESYQAMVERQRGQPGRGR